MTDPIVSSGDVVQAFRNGGKGQRVLEHEKPCGEMQCAKTLGMQIVQEVQY